jgi:hypothetical protein
VPKPKLRLRDWVFGAGGRRRLLEVLLRDPSRAWTQAELAREAELTLKGSVDEHLLALRQLKLIRIRGGRFRVDTSNVLVVPIRDLLNALENVPDATLRRPR